MTSGKLDEARRRIDDLTAEVLRHNRLYFVDDAPEISDAEYDELLRELQALEEAFPELRHPDSPTQRVGAAPAEGFAPVEHRVRMLSLDNAMNEEEMRAFDARVRRRLGTEEAVEYMGEPKLDGASLELVYERGALVVGATRGDGRIGEDVTSNLRHVWSVPFKLTGRARAMPERMSVRGEVVLPIAAFNRLNQQRLKRGEEPFANPRNAAAGALRQLHDVDRRRLGALEFRAYAVGEGVPEGVHTQRELLRALEAFGLLVSPESAVVTGVDEAIAYHARLLEQREKLPIEIDGSVFKVDRFDLREELGTLPRHPRWAVAFKFPPQQRNTVVEDIQVNVGRTGAVTPIAVLRPVPVGGVTVSHASLHNQDEIDRKDVRVGDTVVVQRAGDVIPQIVKVVRSKRPRGTRAYTLPARCPQCGTATVRLEGEAVTRCPNIDCPAQLKNNLVHMGSRGALDVDGLGEQRVDQLVEAGLVKRVSDLFQLTEAQLVKLERMGEKSAANLVESLSRARNTTLQRFLIALGIPLVGEGVADLLARHFGDLDPLMAATREELEAVEGVGPIIAESVVRFFAAKRNASEVERLRTLGVRWEAVAAGPRREGPLAGRTFVLTGTLSGLSRDEARRRIEAAGGTVTASVSKRTDYVVAGENPGSKLARAEALGVEVLDQAAFERLLEG
ncbi:MAG: NAD-dependent DNA ligase LigA [Deltaproteobacteria bacterium]|nr:MAG: NAD-dependent DNA ligase LigA [Deltaproteobacteria bacterium]